MRQLLVLVALVCAPLSFADWALGKFAERDELGEWDVGCSARVSDHVTLEWTGGVYFARSERGDDPAKPLIHIDTQITQSKSRPIEGEVMGENCTIAIETFDIECEPAQEEYLMRVSVLPEDAPARHMDIWMQAVTVTLAGLDQGEADALAGDPFFGAFFGALSGALFVERAVWADWPDDLLEGDGTLMWRRGGVSPTVVEGSRFNPVSASTDLTNTAQLRRQFAACVSSHVGGGRVLSSNLPRPRERGLLERIRSMQAR